MNEELQFYANAAREDFLSFCLFTDQYFHVEPHHEKIANTLQRVADGECKRLIMMLPPRSGKSRIMQEFSAYYLGKNPNKHIINTGHSISLLQGFSRNVRNRVESAEFKIVFPNTEVSPNSSAVNDWTTTTGGEYMIYGVGGGITGKGFHLGIIDDPYASRQDAESDTILRRVNERYDSTFYSRRQDENAAIVIIMQRWREDDLVGKLLDKGGNEWEVIKIPALSEEGESYRPDKFSVEELHKIRKDMGEYYFQSQYQQEPTSDDSGVFQANMFTTDIQPNIDNTWDVITFIDPAISQSQDADYTAIITIAHNQQNGLIYIIDTDIDRYYPDEIVDKVFEKVQLYKPKKVGVEVVQYQKMLALTIKKEMQARQIYFNLIEVRPMGEKEARIKTILRPKYSNKEIIHTSCDKIHILEDQLLKFPNGKHDDAPDALSGAITLLQNKQNNSNNKNIRNNDVIRSSITGQPINIQTHNNYNRPKPFGAQNKSITKTRSIYT